MSRIPALDPAAVQGKAKDLLDAVQKALGVTPNMFRVAAHSPAALEGLLGLNAAVNHGALAAKVREQVALAVAENNSCDYCLSAHTFLGRHAGLSDADIVQARQGRAGDPKADKAWSTTAAIPATPSLRRCAEAISAMAKSSTSLPPRSSTSSPTT